MIFLYHGLKKIEDTVIEADGLRMTVNGKSSGGKQKVFIFVNMRSYFSDEEMLRFMDTTSSQGYST